MLVVVSDIHGCMEKLQRVLDFVDEQDAALICLGDYIDRGPQSLDVLETVFERDSIGLLGNHDVLMMRAAQGDKEADRIWRQNGGKRTLQECVKKGLMDQIPPLGALATERELQTYVRLLRKGKVYYKTQHTLFVHGGIPMDHRGKPFVTHRGERYTDVYQGMDTMEQEIQQGKISWDISLGDENPLWTRELWINTTQQQINRLLAALGIKRLVVGHTHHQGKLLTLFRGVVNIDTGMAYWEEGGGFLVIDDKWTYHFLNGNKVVLQNT